MAITPALTAILATEMRLKRNVLMQESDWMATSDRTLTPQEAEYRTLLRDVPEQAEFPDTIDWPTKP